MEKRIDFKLDEKDYMNTNNTLNTETVEVVQKAAKEEAEKKVPHLDRTAYVIKMLKNGANNNVISDDELVKYTEGLTEEEKTEIIDELIYDGYLFSDEKVEKTDNEKEEEAEKEEVEEVEEAEEEIIYDENEAKRNHNKGFLRGILASAGIAGLVAIIVIAAKSCGNKKDAGQIIDELTSEEPEIASEITSELTSEDLEEVIEVVEIFDAYAYVDERLANMDEKDLPEGMTIENYEAILRYANNAQEKLITEDEIATVIGLIANTEVQEELSAVNKYNGFEGTYGSDTGKWDIKKIIGDSQEANKLIKKLDDLQQTMINGDKEEATKAAKEFFLIYAQTYTEVNDYSNTRYFIGDEEINLADYDLEDANLYYTLPSNEKVIIGTFFTAIQPLPEAILKGQKLKIESTIVADDEEAKEEKITVNATYSLNDIKALFMDPKCYTPEEIEEFGYTNVSEFVGYVIGSVKNQNDTLALKKQYPGL